MKKWTAGFMIAVLFAGAVCAEQMTVTGEVVKPDPNKGSWYIINDDGSKVRVASPLNNQIIEYKGQTVEISGDVLPSSYAPVLKTISGIKVVE